MADQDITDRAALGLSDQQISILRNLLMVYLEGSRVDLEHPEEVPDRERVEAEIGVFKRLLLALRDDEIWLPDREARELVARLARGWDNATEYRSTVAGHDAFHGLLAALDGKVEDLTSCPGRGSGCLRERLCGSGAGRRTRNPSHCWRDGWRRGRGATSDEFQAGNEESLQCRLLALVVNQHPRELNYPEIARVLGEDTAEGQALARAVKALVLDGLLRSRGLVVVPTRAALSLKRLGLV